MQTLGNRQECVQPRLSKRAKLTERRPRRVSICQIPAASSNYRGLASVATPAEHLRPLVSPHGHQVMGTEGLFHGAGWKRRIERGILRGGSRRAGAGVLSEGSRAKLKGGGPRTAPGFVRRFSLTRNKDIFLLSGCVNFIITLYLKTKIAPKHVASRSMETDFLVQGRNHTITQSCPGGRGLSG